MDVKEETFIQTGRRGGDGQPECIGLAAGQQLAEPAVLHLCVDKPGGTPGEPDRLHNPGFQCGEIKPQNL